MNNNLRTKELFDKGYGNRTYEFYKSLLSKCIKYSIPGQWLDIGAGLGLFTECANRFGIKCIGLEGSSYAIKTAKLRYPEMDIRQHLLEDRLTFNDNSISTIICNQVIEHVSKTTATHMLNECYRVLKVKGVIFINSPCRHVKEARLAKTHINLYAPKLLKKEVENIGFRILRIDNYPRMFAGNSPISKYLAILIFRLFPVDILSSTANCIAIKLS